ncbi:MAG: protein kinase [Planctomycetes bacterium]|nr:protein kinase [Planctomycetota bacterium]
MILRLRRGQAEERDRRLAEILIERGLLVPEEARDLRHACDPGTFGDMLVRMRRVSDEQLARFERESGVREVMAALHDRELPEEVREALQNTLARVGKYVLVKVLGRGGMGEVWKGWDNQLHRWVALKFLTGDHPEVLRRFLREADLASQLSHPGITRVYEIGVHPKRPFIALEFVDGKSLEGGKLDRRRAAEIVRDAARAVHYAHEKGVIHRDLKPANVLEARDGRVFVTDFGLARPASGGGSLTVSGAVLGTPHFMAPEQALGRPADARTDVYGLGATLYALLEGRPPHEGTDSFEIIQRASHGATPPQTAHDDLSVIVRKAMEAERRDRYETAAALADELERFLRGDPILARPVGHFTRGMRVVRRHPAYASTIVLLAAAVVAGIFLGNRLLRERRDRTRIEEANREIDAARPLLAQIDRMQEAGRADDPAMEQALSLLESRAASALRIASDYAPAIHLQGLSQFYRRRYREAEATFSRVLSRDPTYHDARGRRGLARFYLLSWVPLDFVQDEGSFRIRFVPYPSEDEERIRGAEEDFRSLPAGHRDREYGLAFMAFARGDFEAARTGLRRLLGEASFRAEAWHFLALAELLAGDPDASLRASSRAIELGLKDAPTHSARAFGHAVQGRFDAAVEDAAAALARNPEWPQLRRLRAAWLIELRRFEEALREYDVLLARPPERTDDLLNRSIAYSELGHHESAIRDAARAVEIAPRDPWTYWRLGRNRIAAAQALIKARKTEPALGELRGAEAAFDGMISCAPAEPEGYVQRGMARMRMSRFEEALADFEKAVSLRADLRETLRGLMDTCRKNIR